MKIKGYRGPPNVPPIRISNGVYAARYPDGTWVYKRRPRQVRKNDDNAKFNRDQLRLSAWMVKTTDPVFVASAHQFAKNSNDTWKDVLTRAQFGTLFRITLADGTEYHPADHSYQGAPPEPGPTSMAWTMLAQLTGAWAPAASLDAVIPSGITEIIIWAQRITGTVASTLGVRVSVDGGVTYKAGAADYSVSPSGGVSVNAGIVQITNAATANFQSGAIWIPNTNWGDKKVLLLNPSLPFNSAIYHGTADPVNAVRLVRTAGNLSGDANSYAWIMGR